MSDKKDIIRGSLISAISAGSLLDVKKLVLSHGLSCCEGLYGGYALICNAIESGHFEVAKFLLHQGTNVAYELDRVSTPLHFATQKNCVELVQLLLETNAPINARNGQNETALHMAAKEGYLEIVKVLLSNNADLTAQTQDDSTPLLLAAEHGAAEVVRILLQHACANFKLEEDLTPLVSPGKKSNLIVLSRILLCNPSIHDKVNKLIVRIVNLDEGHSQIVDDLIDYGFVVSREYINESLLLAAIEKKYEKLIKSILTIASPSDAKHNLLLLHSAIHNKQQKIVVLFGSLGFEASAKSEDVKFSSKEDKLIKAIELLLASGANIKEFPDLLHTFVMERMVEVCRVLIEKGADVNALTVGIGTPLHLSCDFWASATMHMQEMEKITKLLLNSGADLSIKDSTGRTALHNVAQSGGKEAVSALLKFGADVNSLAEDGSTPLHLACNEEIVEILCNNKATLDVHNKKGRTPLHCAAYWQKKEVVKKLIKLGADIEVRGLSNETALHSLFSPDFEEWPGWGSEIATMLLSNECDANGKTSEGRTVLDMAYSKAKSNFYDNPENAEFSVSFDPESNLSGRSVEAIESVKQHLMKLEVAGLCEASPDKFDEITDLLSGFRKECEEEVERMKDEQLNSEFTLFDVLVKSKALTFTKVNLLMHFLEVFDFLKYPIYESLIKGTLERRKVRLDLMRSGHKSLGILIRTSSKLNGKKCIALPIELLELIVSYLSNSDLRSLMSCSDALKRQLSV